jgi:hypothetical protein
VRNLALFGVLIALITYVYFTEERKSIELNKRREAQEKLFDASNFGKIKEVSAANFLVFEKNNGLFVEKDFEVNLKNFNTFMDQLLKINVMRIFTDEEQKQIDKKLIQREKPARLTMVFENNEITFEIGKKIEFSQDFYLKVTNKKRNKSYWTVARLKESYTVGNQQKDSYRSAQPYNQALSIFNLDADFFKDKNPFDSISPITKVLIQSFRNKEYELNFALKTTEPMPPGNVKINEARVKNYVDTIKQVQFMKILKKGELDDLVGYLFFDKKKKFTLYRKHNDQKGYYLLADDFVYVLSGQSFRALFAPHQSFWYKRLPAASENIKIENMKDELILKSKLTDKNIWTRLFSREANHVSKQDVKKFNAEYKLTTGKQTYLVRQEGGTIEVLDTNQGVIFHFFEEIK